MCQTHASVPFASIGRLLPAQFLDMLRFETTFDKPAKELIQVGLPSQRREREYRKRGKEKQTRHHSWRQLSRIHFPVYAILHSSVLEY